MLMHRNEPDQWLFMVKHGEVTGEGGVCVAATAVFPVHSVCLSKVVSTAAILHTKTIGKPKSYLYMRGIRIYY